MRLTVRLGAAAMACAFIAGCAVDGVAGPAQTASSQNALPDYAKGRLTAVLEHSRRDEDRARDVFRHPAETMAFFGVEPGMTVVESLPSANGYYTKIILPYLGDEGTYYGLHYPVELAERIFPERFITVISAFPDTFPTSVAEADWAGERYDVDGAFLWDAVPEEVIGAADVVFHSRSLHHMSRGGEMELAAQASYDLLKPGGVAAVVQHRAREDASAEDALGNQGYIKQSDVVAAFEAAGFVLEAASEINANPKDLTDHTIGVWRLPPSLRVDDETTRRANLAIGETDRMTLKFRKPA